MRTSKTLAVKKSHASTVPLVPSATLPEVLDEALLIPAHRFTVSTGKRIRAAMVNESYRAAGGRFEAPPEVSEAIELLHAGSLIVDDIEDDSNYRRGQPTLHREVGLPVALNVGNWMYFQSLERLAESSLPPKIIHKMLKRSVLTIRKCHEGQALDLGANVSSLPVIEMVNFARETSRLKTGGLTALSAWLGAIAAGSNTVTRRAFARFGMATGVCLQMKNDLSELRDFVDGSARCDDLRNARVTWAWALAARYASEATVVSLQRQLRAARGRREYLRKIAQRLLEIVAARGHRYVARKLQRSLRLLGEHVESTSGLRQALERLEQKR